MKVHVVYNVQGSLFVQYNGSSNNNTEVGEYLIENDSNIKKEKLSGFYCSRNSSSSWPHRKLSQWIYTTNSAKTYAIFSSLQ